MSDSVPASTASTSASVPDKKISQGNGRDELQRKERRASIASQQQGQQGSVILRIKRKRGTDPVSALRIFQQREEEEEEESVSFDGDVSRQEDVVSPASPSLEEETSRTKRRMLDRGGGGGLSIFRFAQRVSLDRFKERDAAASIHREIRRGEGGTKPAAAAKKHSGPDTGGEDLRFRVVRQQQQQQKEEGEAHTKKEVKAQEGKKTRSKQLLVDALKRGKRATGTLSTSSSSSSLRSLNKRYSAGSTLRDREVGRDGANKRGSRTLKAPPEVVRASPYPRIRVIDAIADDDGETSRRKGRAKRKQMGASQPFAVAQKKEENQGQAQASKEAAAPSPSVDAEIDALDRRFADLLGDYLKANDLEPPRDLYTAKEPTEQEASSSSSEEEEEDSDSEYVYDIYYREREPASTTSWGSGGAAGNSDVGLRPAQVQGHGSSSSALEKLGPRAPAIEMGMGIAPAETMTRSTSAQWGPQHNQPMATLFGLTSADIRLLDRAEEGSGEGLVDEAGDDPAGLASILVPDASDRNAVNKPGDSDDDFDEGEDEDSNDEGFYRNDYPDREVGEDEEEAEAYEDDEVDPWGWAGPRKQRRDSASSEEGEGEGDSSDGEGSDMYGSDDD